MTTTVMRDSVVGDAWIKEMCQLNPVQRVVGKDGHPNGFILTGPVRLAFIDSLFVAKPQMKNDPKALLKHSITILFPPYADLAIFWEEYYRIAAASFPDHYVNGQYHGLDNPIYDAATKMKHPGFTPGCMAMNTSSNFPPPVTDMRNNPVVPSAVQSGFWGIVALNPYASGKNFPRKGPRFGLGAVMIIGPDTPLRSGAGVNAQEAFSGVNVRPPTGVVPQGFGQGGPQASPPGGGVQTFYPPGGAPGGAPGGFAAPRPVTPPPLGSGADDTDVSSLV